MPAPWFPRSRSFRRTLLGIVPVALLVTAAGAAEPPETFELRPGVVVDHHESRVYVMNPAGGIDCLRLGEGTVVWHSADADKPLALQGSHLVAQGENQALGSLDLAVLSKTTGNSLHSFSASLPDTVMGRIDEGLGHSFRAWGDATSDRVIIAWTSSRQLAQGMPTDLAVARPRLHEGAFAVNAQNGTAAEVEIPPRLLAKWRPLLAGNQRLSAVTPGRQFLSADERHVLVSERIDASDGWKEYRWTIYTRAGDRLGSFETFVSYSPFFVAASTLIYETRPFARRIEGELVKESLKIRAVDLSNGVEQWQFAIRDTSYYGPHPP